ncbi:MAG: 30S ribosomal protein S16 [Actinomycetota bacterium]
MSTRIRLRRMGASKRPFYRVVVADQRDPRDGRFIEAIGKYHPLDDPSVIEIDEGRALHWLNNGAQPSDTVQNLLDKIGIWEKYAADHPKVKVKAEAKAKTDALKFKRGEARNADIAKQAAADAKAKAATEAAEAKAEAAAEQAESPGGDDAPADVTTGSPESPASDAGEQQASE